MLSTRMLKRGIVFIMRTKIMVLLTAFLLTSCSATESSGNTGNSGVQQNAPVWEGDLPALKQTVDACKNLHAADDLILSAPDSAKLYTFTVREHPETDYAVFEADFQMLYQYVFPDRQIKPEHLYYVGSYTYDEDFEWYVTPLRLAKDYREKLVSGEVDFDGLWYDDAEHSEYFGLGPALDHGNSMMNRGVTQRLTGSTAKPDNFYPQEEYRYLKTLPPDSTETVTLLNGETRICDAVAAFSEYIDKMPYPKEQNLQMTAAEVRVYQVTEDCCGLLLNTVPVYEGVPYEHWDIGSYRGSLQYRYQISPWAWMIETDKPDELMSWFRYQHTEEMRQIQKTVSLSDACRTVSDGLSAAITFEVQRIDFVYIQQYLPTEGGYIDLENGQPCRVYPSWRFTLYNPNDTMHYLCWIDAESGGNMEYISYREEPEDEADKSRSE